jgi:hypothetical protein
MSMGTEFYIYHHIIAIWTPLNWFGPWLKDIPTSDFIENGFGVEAVKKMWE